MTPQRFREANTIMGRPKDMTEGQCSDIHAYRDGQCVVTAWRPTPEELMKINMGEPVWLTVMGGGMPPVSISADSPFEEDAHNKGEGIFPIS